MAYIVMGLIAWLIVIPLSRLLRKDPAEIGLSPDGVKSAPGENSVQDKQAGTQPDGFSLSGAFSARSFWLLEIAVASFSFCFFLVATHIVPHATDVGISAAMAAAALALIGAFVIPGKLIMGGLSDRLGRKTSAIACALLQAIAMIWLIWSKDLWMLYLFAIVYGFGYGGTDAIITALVGDIFGVRSIGAIMGVVTAGWAIGAAIGPFVGGLTFDISKSYFVSFLIGALVLAASALSIALTKQETKGTAEVTKQPYS